MHGHDAVLDIAFTAQVLPLHARGPVALLAATGLVEQTDGAQLVPGGGRERPQDVLLHHGAEPVRRSARKTCSARTADPPAMAIGSTDLRGWVLSRPRQ